MIALDRVPSGIDEILAYYGTPYNEEGELDSEWYAAHTDVFELPVPLLLSWDTSKEINRIRAHKKVGYQLVDAIAEIAWFYREKLRENEYDRYGGVFNFRYKRGGDSLSTHAWGIAIDFNPHIGRLGSQADANTYPKPIVEIFEERGFVWGGRWVYPDAMHFQACNGY